MPCKARGSSRTSSTETIASLIGTSQSIHDYPPILTELQLLHVDGLKHISAGEQTALKDTLPRSQTDETHGRQCYPGYPEFRHIIGLRRGSVSRLRLLRRRGFTPERIAEIHDACRILFQSGLNYMSGCEEVEKQIPQSAERDELVRFIRESKRGIIKPYEAKAKEE